MNIPPPETRLRYFAGVFQGCAITPTTSAPLGCMFSDRPGGAAEHSGESPDKEAQSWAGMLLFKYSE